jgi:hypothetical protein
MSRHRIARSLALTFALATLAAPASAATDPAEHALHVRSVALNERYAPDVRIVRMPAAPVASSDGIDWADAAIGAGAMTVGLGLVSLSAYGVMRRRRTVGQNW